MLGEKQVSNSPPQSRKMMKHGLSIHGILFTYMKKRGTAPDSI